MEGNWGYAPEIFEIGAKSTHFRLKRSLTTFTSGNRLSGAQMNQLGYRVFFWRGESQIKHFWFIQQPIRQCQCRQFSTEYEIFVSSSMCCRWSEGTAISFNLYCLSWICMFYHYHFHFWACWTEGLARTGLALRSACGTVSGSRTFRSLYLVSRYLAPVPSDLCIWYHGIWLPPFDTGYSRSQRPQRPQTIPIKRPLKIEHRIIPWRGSHYWRAGGSGVECWTSDPEVQGSNSWGTGRWGLAASPSPWLWRWSIPHTSGPHTYHKNLNPASLIIYTWSTFKCTHTHYRESNGLRCALRSTRNLSYIRGQHFYVYSCKEWNPPDVFFRYSKFCDVIIPDF